jgi:hypothetical protein
MLLKLRRLRLVVMPVDTAIVERIMKVVASPGCIVAFAAAGAEVLAVGPGRVPVGEAEAAPEGGCSGLL